MSNARSPPEVGDACLLAKGIGMVRYLGSLAGIEGKGYGIELVTPDGNSDGTYTDGESYFKCKPNYGLFVPASQIKRKITPQELLNKMGMLNKKMKTLAAN